MSGGRRRARGFTLIEVLLATTLLAAGLALAFATLRASTTVAQRGELLSQRSERVRSVEGFLRRRIASALPIAFANDTTTNTPQRFVGEPDRIRFVADLPDYLGRGGPHLHDVRIVDGDDGTALAVAFALVVGGQSVEENQPRPPEPLVPDLLEVSFRYRGMDAQNQLAEWTDRWETVERLPLLVEIGIVSTTGGRWPPLVIALPQGAADPNQSLGRPFR
ncbi:MAG: prepilin-type N-terminal cleavage/methylation domain-containing protein [Luteimonas sp.]